MALGGPTLTTTSAACDAPIPRPSPKTLINRSFCTLFLLLLLLHARGQLNVLSSLACCSFHCCRSYPEQKAVALRKHLPPSSSCRGVRRRRLAGAPVSA